MSLDNCRIVLVRPRVAGNLGSTARVMRNMGLSDLVLVAPEADPEDPRARRLSTHGEAIHFVYGPKADSLMHALRHLIGRARPSRMEVEVLCGLARQVRWFVENKSRGGAP
jgi:tRNA C32,U32 (ribose-2'-O)-methylase TrmJ